MNEPDGSVEFHQRTLDPIVRHDASRRDESRARRRHRAHAAVAGPGRRCRRARGGGGVSRAGARRRRSLARAGDVQIQAAARGALRGAGAAGHDRAREDARRVARQRAARRSSASRSRAARRRCSWATASRTSRAASTASVDAAADRRRARRSRRSTFPRWCRSGSCRSRSPCGNTFVLKPSEQVPLSQQRMFELLEQCDLPPGVVNMVHGGKGRREAICDHPDIKAVSFVGSTPVARLVYQRATHSGQARAGARRREELHRRDARRRSGQGDRRHRGVVLRLRRRALPGGQHARAGRRARTPKCAIGWSRRAESIKVGDGCEPGVTMGPVISARHKERVLGYIEQGVKEGAKLVADGRARQVPARRVLRRPDGLRPGVAADDRSGTKRSSGRWRRWRRPGISTRRSR